jgi:hypothetical protein
LQINYISLLPEAEICSNIRGINTCRLAVWGKSDASRATMFSTLEVRMEQQSLGNSSAAAPGSRSSAPHREGRGVWVLTAYGISGLALFGILIYYASTYVTH